MFTDGTFSYSDVSLSSSYEAAKAAYNKAAVAQQAAENTNQYFWVDEDGAHVSMVEGEADSGKNMFMDSTGIFLRDGENTLAKFDGSLVTFYDGNEGNDENIVAMFGEDGAQVGYSSSKHLNLSPDSITAVSDIGAKLFSVGSSITSEQALITTDVGKAFKITSTVQSNPSYFDVRLPLKNEVSGGYLQIDYECYGYTEDQQNQFREKGTLNCTIGTAKNETVILPRAHLEFDYYQVTLSSKPAHFLIIHAYKSNSYIVWIRIISVTYDGYTVMPTYDLGTRVQFDNFAGPFSTVIGESLVASGNRQIAIGRYNAEDTNDEYILIVGNGTDNQNRSNALTVDWDGNVNTTGSITQNGQPLFQKEDVTVSVTYAAGTIGSRGATVSLGTTVKTGYTYIGAVITDHRNTSVFSATVVHNGPNNTAHLAVYRATGNAASDLSVTVRKIWVLSSFASS